MVVLYCVPLCRYMPTMTDNFIKKKHFIVEHNCAHESTTYSDMYSEVVFMQRCKVEIQHY